MLLYQKAKDALLRSGNASAWTGSCRDALGPQGQTAILFVMACEYNILAFEERGVLYLLAWRRI